VWTVALDDLTEPALVPARVAAALGVDDRPGDSPTQRLVEHMRDRRALLVLDNCEHLLNAMRHAGRRASARIPNAADASDEPGTARH
jgi:predicted ATPase